MAPRGASAALHRHQTSLYSGLSDGSGYFALRLFGGASWVGDSLLASLERD